MIDDMGGREAKIRGKQGGCHLGAELFERIGVVAEFPAKLSVEPVRVAGPMPCLMRQRRSEIRAGGKQRDRRHRDAVGNGVVEGAVAALVNPRRKGIEEALRRSEEQTSELQSLMRISSAVFCLK